MNSSKRIIVAIINLSVLSTLIACGDVAKSSESSESDPFRALELLAASQDEASLRAALTEDIDEERELAESLAALEDESIVSQRPAPEPADLCAGLPRTAQAVRPAYVSLAWAKPIPLRCGFYRASRDDGYGYRKLVGKGRWNPWFKGMIGATLATDPEPERRENRKGTFGYLFKTKLFTNCPVPYRFKVMVSRDDVKVDKEGLQMKGVLTAYQDFVER